LCKRAVHASCFSLPSKTAMTVRLNLCIFIAAFCLLLISKYHNFVRVAAAAAIDSCGPDLCSSAKCCERQCHCNGYKRGICEKRGGPIASCWCSNDLTLWHTPPQTCKSPKKRV
ncbi:hypothetical protein T02_13474, partial [Trichinella nativa]